MGELKQRIIKNIGLNILNIIVLKFGAFLLTIILARLLQPELFGLYSLALSVSFIAMGLANTALDSTFTYFTANALGKNNKKQAKSYFSFLLKFKLIIATTLATIIFISAELISKNIFNNLDLIPLLKIISIYIIFQSVLEFFNSTFYAIQKIKYIAITQVVYQTLKLLIMPLLIILGYSVFGAIMGLLIATILSVIFIIIVLYKKHKFFFKEKFEKIDKKRIIKYFAYMILISFSGVFLVNIDALMIGAILPIAQVGFYKAAYAIVFSIAGILGITSILFPVFTQLDIEKLKPIFKKVFHYSAMLTIPSTIGLIFIAKPFIELIYGAEYSSAFTALIPLSFLIITAATGILFANLFAAKEKLKEPTVIIFIATLMNIVLNYFLINSHGIFGAGIATTISRYFNIISLGFLANKKLGITINLSSIWKPLVASAGMGIFLLWFNSVIGLVFPLAILEIFLAILVYFGLMWLLNGIKSKD